MGFGTLVLRGLRFYWRTHLGVLLGSALAAAVLVGALVVGDSVRYSLREQAVARIGQVDVAMAVRERFFGADMGARLQQRLSGRAVTLLTLDGVASVQGERARTALVQVLGVDRDFFALGPKPGPADPTAPELAIPGGQVALSAALARQLDVQAGDRLLLRVAKPSALPRDLALSRIEDVALALPVTVAEAVIDDPHFGRFGLRSTQVPPANAFVDLAWLQQELDLVGQANTVLGAGFTAEQATAAVRELWQLSDLQLDLSPLAPLAPGAAGAGAGAARTGLAELTSARVFLDPVTMDVVRQAAPDAWVMLTWFLNGITRADRLRAIPYSMVTGWGAAEGSAGNTATPSSAYARAAAEVLPPAASVAGVPPGEGEAAPPITLSAWAAADLEVALGDEVVLEYYVMGPQLRLLERSQRCTVQRIVPLTGVVADPSLMPPFPGLADSENCRDWEPGIPVDLERIRDVDEDYWDEHRGTPKAFVSLATAQQLWANPYGEATAVRLPAAAADDLRAALRRDLEPARLGFFFVDVRTPALASGTSATDFGGLFLGLSFFLIVAALLLTAMLFAFGVEQRAREMGTLLAVGYRPTHVRRLILGEALVLAAVGALLGVALGAGYSAAVLNGLGGLWRGAVGSAALQFSFSWATAMLGAGLAVVASLFAIAWTVRRMFRVPAVELLGSGVGFAGSAEAGGARRGATRLGIAAVATVGAVALAVYAGWRASASGAAAAAPLFFGAGSLVLIAGLCAASAWLRRQSNRRSSGSGGRARLASVAQLGGSNARRRPGRSVAAVALLGSGVFLVLAVQANQLRPPQDPTARSSGTGGFTLFGRSTLPVLRDLDTPAGRAAYGLDGARFDGVALLPCRVREGDDASCLNLGQPQNPQLWGVPSAALATRGAFVPEGGDASSPWTLLQGDYGADVVPAIGDAASVTWTLHKGIGDDLEYVDEAGRPFKVRIVATVTNSILQGPLVVDEKRFRERFPSEAGYRAFLIDAPPARREEVASALSRSLEDLGLEVTRTDDRLAAFQEVQNTYLSIFQVLGGLGLLLGSVGLGLVVLRNGLERRGELALLSAVGYRAATVRRVLFWEHGLLLGLGVAVGVVAAVVGIAPMLVDGNAWAGLLLFAGLVAASGGLWVWLACRVAVHSAHPGALQDGL